MTTETKAKVDAMSANQKQFMMMAITIGKEVLEQKEFAACCALMAEQFSKDEEDPNTTMSEDEQSFSG